MAIPIEIERILDQASRFMSAPSDLAYPTEEQTALLMVQSAGLNFAAIRAVVVMNSYLPRPVSGEQARIRAMLADAVAILRMTKDS